jgi:hypothetical protein
VSFYLNWALSIVGIAAEMLADLDPLEDELAELAAEI